MSDQTESMENKESVGQELRKARQAKNLSLDDVARATKIRKDFLQAIEESRYDILPGPVFVSGFVRCYGRFLGLDESKYTPVSSGNSSLSHVETQSSLGNVDTSRLVVAGVTVVLVAIFFVVFVIKFLVN